MRSDARALLSERLFGDLNDDLLAFLQQVGDGWQRRPFSGTAERSGSALFGTAWSVQRTRLRRGLADLASPGIWLRFCLGSSPGSAATHLAAHAARKAVHVAAALLADLSGERRGAGRRSVCCSRLPSGADSSSGVGSLASLRRRIRFQLLCSRLFGFLDTTSSCGPAALASGSTFPRQCGASSGSSSASSATSAIRRF